MIDNIQTVETPGRSIVSPRRMRNLIPYFDAIDALTSLYGSEVKHSLLNGEVKLGQFDVKLLAAVAAHQPSTVEPIAEYIKARNQPAAKRAMISLRSRVCTNIPPKVESIRFKKSVSSASRALCNAFDDDELIDLIVQLRGHLQRPTITRSLESAPCAGGNNER